MTYELTKEFRFDAAHMLDRDIDRESSRRLHGHSYRALVTVAGEIDPASGMVLDLGRLTRALEGARIELDHRLLNEVPALGQPTLEHLCRWIWRHLADDLPGLAAVTVRRDSTGDRCRYTGPDAS